MEEMFKIYIISKEKHDKIKKVPQIKSLKL